MIEIVVMIRNKAGLHARPAAQFVQKAASFSCKVKIAGNNKVADGKSILAVMGMSLIQNTTLTIRAEGVDEEACIIALQQLIESDFGEGKS